jgi:hypothetical protein
LEAAVKSEANHFRIASSPIFDGEKVQSEPADSSRESLSIVVPYTTPDLTRAALRQFAACKDLDVHIFLVDVQVVPFPCPLDQPLIDKEHAKRRLQGFLDEDALSGDAAVLYARDWLEAFRRLLGPRSLVVLATRKRWWPTRERKLARALTKAGHHVMLLPATR